MSSAAGKNVAAWWRLNECMEFGLEDNRGVFWTFMLNVLDACALEAAKRMGWRTGAMHANATLLALVKRLTRALDQATDPFNSTYESRAQMRVDWGL